NLMKGWPNAIDELLCKIVDSRRNLGVLRQVLGPISRFCNSTYRTPLRQLVEERVRFILRDLNLPFKVFSFSGALCAERTNSIALTDAMREFNIGCKSLQWIAASGDCLLEKASGGTGVHLFDRAKLQT